MIYVELEGGKDFLTVIYSLVAKHFHLSFTGNKAHVGCIFLTQTRKKSGRKGKAIKGSVGTLYIRKVISFSVITQLKTITKFHCKPL